MSSRWSIAFVAFAVACGGSTGSTGLGSSKGGTSGGGNGGGVSAGGSGASGGIGSGGAREGAGGTGGTYGGADGGGGNAGKVSGGGTANAGGGGAGNGGAGNITGVGGALRATGGSGGAVDAGAPTVCPGVVLPSGYSTCRTAADCPNQIGFVCQHGPATGCGPAPPPPQCYADGDCKGGELCLVVAPSGCSGEGSHCIPPCTGTSCMTDEVCGADGHCQPKPCTAGFACVAGTVCGPSKAGADAHGCAPASCASDGYLCATGFRCAASAAADVHGCSDVSCADGFKCPVNFDCNTASQSPHHCEWRGCTADADCDCGACVQSRCQDRLFVCSMLPA